MEIQRIRNLCTKIKFVKFKEALHRKESKVYIC